MKKRFLSSLVFGFSLCTQAWGLQTESQDRGASLEVAAQTVQSVLLPKNLEKIEDAKKSGAVTQAGRIPLSAMVLGAGAFAGHSYSVSSSEGTRLSIKPVLRERSGEIRLQSQNSFSEMQWASESRIGVGQDLPQARAQTKIHYLPRTQDVRILLSKQMTPHLNVAAERSLQAHYEAVMLHYEVRF